MENIESFEIWSSINELCYLDIEKSDESGGIIKIRINDTYFSESLYPAFGPTKKRLGNSVDVYKYIREYFRNYKEVKIIFHRCEFNSFFVNRMISMEEDNMLDISLVFFDCEFRSFFNILQSKFKNIILIKSTIRERLFIGLSQIDDFIFDRSSADRVVFENEDRYFKEVDIKYNIYENGYKDFVKSFRPNNEFGNIKILHAKIGKIVCNLLFVCGNIELKEVEAIIDIHAAIINSISGSISTASLNNCLIGNLKIQNVIDNLYLRSSFIRDIHISGSLRRESALIMEELRVVKLIFETFENFGILQIKDFNLETSFPSIGRDIKTNYRDCSYTYRYEEEYTIENKTAKLVLNYSSLGDALFINIFFCSEVQFEFNASSIENIKIFEHDKFLREITPNDSRCIPEYFTQLASIYNRKNDIESANFFAKKFLDYQLNELSNKNDEYSRAKRWVLWLNKYSNEYGSNWILTLKLYFRYSVLFFIGTCLAFYLSICDNNVPINSLAVQKFFFRFFFPTGNFERLNIFLEDLCSDCESVNLFYGVANVIDIAWRIFSSYLVYQFIYAFRNYGKRKL